MDRLPFTLYDVLACVISGLVLLVAGDATFGTARLLQGDLGLASSVIVAFGAYILGHVVAHLSGLLFERVLVRTYLGSPEELLLCQRRRGIRAFLFPGYFDPLSARAREDGSRPRRWRNGHRDAESLLRALSRAGGAPQRPTTSSDAAGGRDRNGRFGLARLRQSGAGRLRLLDDRRW